MSDSRACRNRRGAAALLASGLGMLLLAGCQAMAVPWLMWGEPPTRLVPAEYPYLSGKRVCLVVWADMDTTFSYPHVQLEVSEHVARALQANQASLTITPNRSVVDYQRSEPDWDKQRPGRIGEHFGAERVVMIELTEYSTRDADSPHLYRGRIGANLAVYQVEHPDADASFRTAVETLYPKDSVGEWGSTDDSIRRAAMEVFADDVAAKFFDRKVKIR